jgi:hypothetical protein
LTIAADVKAVRLMILPGIRASGHLVVISSLTSQFMVLPRQDRANSPGCGDWAFILGLPGRFLNQVQDRLFASVSG